jgi:hypothetical protein
MFRKNYRFIGLLAFFFLVTILCFSFLSFTPLCIENAHGNVAFSFISHPLVGVLNEKRCKEGLSGTIDVDDDDEASMIEETETKGKRDIVSLINKSIAKVLNNHKKCNAKNA